MSFQEFFIIYLLVKDTSVKKQLLKNHDFHDFILDYISIVNFKNEALVEKCNQMLRENKIYQIDIDDDVLTKFGEILCNIRNFDYKKFVV